MRQSPKPSLEARLRDLLDLPPFPQRSLVLREDVEEEPEEENLAQSADNFPFERYLKNVHFYY